MKLKKENGITLIALVITIIVLLILAGVTLSLVAGENGILKRATNAVDVNERASAEEQANLVLAEIVTKYYEERYVNNNAGVGTIEAYIQTQLSEARTTEGGYTVQIKDGKVEVSKNGKPISSGEIVDGKVEWTGSDTTGGNTGTKKSLASQISATNYGDKVNYSVEVNGVTLDNWRVFYKDELKNEIIMIMGTELSNATGLATNAGLNTNGDMHVYFDGSRADLIQKLETPNLWNDLLSPELKAKKAVAKGAIDLETWVASWNANPNRKSVYTRKTEETMQDGLYGYYVGTSANPSDVIAEQLNNGLNYEDYNMYLRYNAWYLSTPSAYTEDCIFITTSMDCTGLHGNYSFMNDTPGRELSICPVVVLPSNVSGEQLEDGSWNIE